jgi:hypothetical protein
MRAPSSILIAVALVGSALPASGSLFGLKQSSPPPSGSVTPQASKQVVSANSNVLLAQATVANPAPVSPSPGVAHGLHLKGPGPHNGDWLRKYFGLPPAQQEKTLEQDPLFRSLPADRQQHLLDRLRSFNNLPPDKQQKILNRMETYEHLPQEKQAEARSLFQQYHSLPSDQKIQMSQAYHKLRNMSPEQRTQYMNSDEFRNSFNDQQRELLRGMNELADSAVR